MDFSQLQKRLDSYKNWPKTKCQKPEDLASAGFYYIGIDDRVKCYACGGGLKDWEIDDKPWDEHAIWYGDDCFFVRLNKGDHFVQKVKKEYKLRNKPLITQNISQIENSVDKHLCKICFNSELSILFIPCMHIITCETCSLQIQNCPICRERIEKYQKIYYS